MNKKILICTNLTIPYTSGSGINAYNFGKSLKNKGYEVSILTFNWNLRLKRKKIVNNITIIRIPYFYSKVLIKSYLRVVVTLPFYFYYLFFYKTIIIYGRISGYQAIILFGKIFKRNVIFRSTCHGNDDIDDILNRYPLLKHIHKYIFNKLYGYYAISPAFKKSFIKNVNNKSIVIFESPQGVDTERNMPIGNKKRSELKNKLCIPHNKTVIITVGNVTDRKGYRGIFETLSKLDDDFLYLVIGNYKANEYYFWQKKKELNYLYELGKKILGKKIIFIGRKENVNEYLQIADIYISNSKREGGLPNSIQEAMACGVVPVIRHLNGVICFNIFPNKNSVVFNNENEMQDAISKLIINKTYRSELAKNAVKFINENCSLEKVTQNFIKTFNI